MTYSYNPSPSNILQNLDKTIKMQYKGYIYSVKSKEACITLVLQLNVK